MWTRSRCHTCYVKSIMLSEQSDQRAPIGEHSHLEEDFRAKSCVCLFIASSLLGAVPGT